VRRLVRGVTVLLMTGLLTTACSGGGPSQTASPGSSTPKAELPPGGSAGPPASVPQHPGSNGRRGKAHARLVVNNGKISVCSLITRRQVDQIMSMRLPAPMPVIVGTFDECATTQRRGLDSAAARAHVAWAVPPESNPRLAFRQMTINLPQRDAVPGLGDRAYCTSASPASAQLILIAGRNLLEVFADTCDHATALARVALGRL
jgi:hypothetical protein